MQVVKPVQSGKRISALLIIVLLLSISVRALPREQNRIASASTIKSMPAPRDVIGFTPGDDRKLASWSQFVEYFKKLDQASDRVMVQELGRTTLDKPFLVATISSPANLSRLDHFKEIQRKLADPRLIRSSDTEAEKLIAEGRTVVLITCGIHSTEVGANLVSMNIAYKLASDDSAETREILEKCIILLVPSLNPDGIDIVKNWYDKTLGTESEGTGPTELYHHYVGHDNNRDWYAFTQVETQLTVDKIHNLWHPQIVHDIHQQGETGTRFFLPPYVEPWEPNVPPLIQAGVNFMGSSMAWEMIAEGKTGIVINGVYDAWTPARAYQHYHAGIRILSETASARLASPTNVPFERQTPQTGVDTKVRSWNYPVPWKGGEWKLADIVEYQRSGAFALMRNAARYRDRWLRDFYLIGKDAVRERKSGEPFAFLLIPPDKSDKAFITKHIGFSRLQDILGLGGVETLSANQSLEIEGRQYPPGTLIVPMAQPYGAFAKTLLERQKYPDLREYPGGPPRRPYDVTAHTLPLMMGVGVEHIDKPFPIERYGIARVESASPRIYTERIGFDLKSRIGIYKSYAASMDEGWTRWIFDQFEIKYSSLLDAEVKAGNLRAKYDAIIIPEQSARSIVNGLPSNRYPAQYAGGIGEEGIDAIKKFIEDGGTLITFNDASLLAIENLNAPVKDVLAGVSNRDFFCPGSILKLEYNASEPLAEGVPALAAKAGEGIAWFERSPAFEVTGSDARIVARYAPVEDLLLSGWLLGEDKIAGKGAIAEVKRGKGRIIMFGFRPQYRGQTVATLPFIFNAIRSSAP